MAYNFEERLQLGHNRLLAVNHRTILYHRSPAIYTITLASCVEWRPEDYTIYGISQDVRKRDYIFAVSSLPIEPRTGDRITDGNLTLIVAPQGSNGQRDSGPEPCYRFCDHLNTTYRVHSFVATDDGG